MSILSELLTANEQYAVSFTRSSESPRPRRRLALLACMDSRLNPNRALGLYEGDSHLIRNAGGLATPDALRSLIVSQQGLGTQEVVVIQHTDCGLLALKNETLRERLRDRFGVDASHMDFLPITDLEQSVRDTVAAIRACPFIGGEIAISGLIYDVKTGWLHLIEQSPAVMDESSANVSASH
ncbi:MAG: carbonic anhydrase [Chloroflexi bacterium]|nr:carbonic anhydrase [Chloroflexota bacterium]